MADTSSRASLEILGAWKPDPAADRLFGSDIPPPASQPRRPPELAQALDHLRGGDILVVWRLDRLGRSLRHLVDTVSVLEERGVGFRSQTESIDTTTPGGRFIFHVFAALAEFERDLIRERTHALWQRAGSEGAL